MSKKHRQLYKEKSSKFSLLPIAFVISVIPLLVYMKVIELTDIEIENWLGGEVHPDFFNAIKSQWLIIGTILAVVFFFVYSLIKGFEFKKSYIYIPVITYAVLIVLSTITSDYPKVALNGFVARYEGMWVLLCYLVLFVITVNLVKDESQIKFLLGALLISATIIALIGTFQLFNMDIFREDFGKKLILPQAYHQYREGLEFTFEESNVYATLANPNYVGSYVPLVLPIAFVAFLNFKKIYMKIGAGLLMIVLLISLYGSNSAAGVVGVTFSALLALIIFRKVIFKRKVLSIVVVATMVLAFFGVNYAMGGAITEKITNKVQNEIEKLNPSPYIDLKDIIFKDNTVSIVTGTETFIIESNEEAQLKFYDGGGNSLEYSSFRVERDRPTVRFDGAYKDYILFVEDSLITVYYKLSPEFMLKVMEDNTFRLVGLQGELISTVEKPDTLGFVGKDRLGSSRGYIWSRTFPLLKETLVWGYGPDNYAIAFPQDDYIGKLRAFRMTNMIVDKPHNTYLQIATNTGILSLLTYLVLAGIYVVQSLITYIKMEKSFIAFTGAGTFLAICGYLATSFFNDSVVGIAPIFWVLLGLGFLCNKLVKSQQSST